MMTIQPASQQDQIQVTNPGCGLTERKGTGKLRVASDRYTIRFCAQFGLKVWLHVWWKMGNKLPLTSLIDTFQFEGPHFERIWNGGENYC